MTNYTIEQLPDFAHLPQLPRLLELVNELDLHLLVSGKTLMYLGSNKTVHVRTLGLSTGPGNYWDHRLVDIEPSHRGDPEPKIELRDLLQEGDRVPEPEPEEPPTSVTITVEDLRFPELVFEKLASLDPRGESRFGHFAHFGHGWGGWGRGRYEREQRPKFEKQIDLTGLIARLEAIQKQAQEWNLPVKALLAAIAYTNPEFPRADGRYELRELALLLAALPEGEMQRKFVDAKISVDEIRALSEGRTTWQELKAKYGILSAEEEEEQELKEMQVNGGVTIVEHKRVELIPGEHDEDQDWIETGDMVEIEKVQFSYEDGKFFADFDVHRGYYPNQGFTLDTAISLSVFKHRADIPDHLRDSYGGGGEYVKRHIKTPDKRYYGIVEWFED